MADWATHHGVDQDLGLLICACTAAHTAGPLLFFEGNKAKGFEIEKRPPVGPVLFFNGMAPCEALPAPTLIAEAGQTGFYRAVQAAIEPLLKIQKDLIARHGERERPVFKKPFMTLNEQMDQRLLTGRNPAYAHLRNPARHLDPAKQADGWVRFVLEGPLPAKPVEFLRICHLYSALSVAEIERLPRHCQRREARLDRIHSSVCGYREGKVSIRGFMRFTPEDLEWIYIDYRYLIYKTLPVECPDAPVPDAPAGQGTGQPEFASLHELVLQRVVDARRAREHCTEDFVNAGADLRFRKLRERYRAEQYAVDHLDTVSLILPDLFVWYGLQIARAGCLDFDEQELAVHAVAAARRLRWRVAEFHDRQEALRHARKRLRLANKLMARMRKLNRPCKRRDLVRGFDNQRLDRLGPLIDRLVELRIFARHSKWLGRGADWQTRKLRPEDFMNAQEDLLISATRRLTKAEARKDIPSTDQQTNPTRS